MKKTARKARWNFAKIIICFKDGSLKLDIWRHFEDGTIKLAVEKGEYTEGDTWDVNMGDKEFQEKVEKVIKKELKI